MIMGKEQLRAIFHVKMHVIILCGKYSARAVFCNHNNFVSSEPFKIELMHPLTICVSTKKKKKKINCLFIKHTLCELS